MPKVPRLPPFRSSDDQTVQIVQRDNREAIRNLQQTEIVQGKLVTVTLSTGTTKVAHGLGRRWRGWAVFDITAAATVYRDATANVDPTTFIPLVASAGTPTVTLWVF